MTYNHESFIEDAIKGLLNQTYKNLELIILDDSSIDNTRNIIDGYESLLREKFIRVRKIYHEENSGNISANENELIKETEGEFIISTSGDDCLIRNAIEILVDVLQRQTECSVACANMFVVNENWHYGDTINEKRLWIRDQEEGVQKHLFKRLMYGNCISAPTVIVKKGVIERNGLHDESIMYEDYEYWLRISQRENVYYLNKPVIWYRYSQYSSTNYLGDKEHKKLKKSMEVDYKVRKKYLGLLTKDEQEFCLEHYYDEYYSLCKKNRCDEGISFLNNVMLENGVEIKTRENFNEILEKRISEENRILTRWIQFKQCKDDYGIISSAKKIAIYGFGKLGKLLYRDFKESGIEVAEVIDRKGNLLNTNVDIKTLNDRLEPVDYLINTVLGGCADQIADELIQRTKSKVIYIGELFGL